MPFSFGEDFSPQPPGNGGFSRFEALSITLKAMNLQPIVSRRLPAPFEEYVIFVTNKLSAGRQQFYLTRKNFFLILIFENQPPSRLLS